MLLLLSSLAVASPLQKTGEIQLRGAAGRRLNSVVVDAADHLLLSAHPTTGRLYAIDLRTRKVVGDVAGVPGVEGILVVPAEHKAYTANAGGGVIGVIDLRTMKLVRRLTTLPRPETSALEPRLRRLFVAGRKDHSVSVVDIEHDRVIRTLRFPGPVGVLAWDPVARRIYATFANGNELAVIDPATDRIAGRYPVAGCQGIESMALDPASHRAFFACAGSDSMTVFDLDRHRVVTSLPLAKGPGVIRYDAGLKRIYVACASGVISIFQQQNPNRYYKMEDFPVGRPLRNLAIDPEAHLLYVPEQPAKDAEAVVAIYREDP